MIQIRKNVFETNSSSTHSLVISKKDRGYDYNLPVDEDGILTISFGEFGWGPEILNTPLEKISYVITDQGYEVNDVFNEEDALELAIVERVINLIKEKCPAVKDVKIKPASIYYPYGYVDHQSTGTSQEDEDLEHLIFSKDVIILIDNDNSYHFEDYFPDYWEDNPAKKDIEELF